MRTIIILGILVAAMMLMPAAQAKNPHDPCNGIWYREVGAGPVTVGTNGSLGCTDVYVFLPTLRQCVTEGEPQHVRSIENVHIYQETCA